MAFDVSTISTGYSVLDDKGNIKYEYLGKIETKKEKSFIDRLFLFRKKVRDLLVKIKPDKIVIEDIYFARNLVSYKSLAMFHGVLFVEVKDILGIEPIYITVTEARSFFNLKSKEEVFSFVTDRYGLNKFDFNHYNDITDSIILGLTYIYRYLLNCKKETINGRKEKKRAAKRQ